MSGLGRIVVGYRPDERGRYLDGAREAGRCQGCGSPVWLVASGQDAIMAQDALLVCSYCHDHHKDEILAEL